MKLDNVYWDEALDLVIETAGLRKIEADTVIRVVTGKEYEDETKRRLTERESFRKDRLERQKMGEEFITETVYLSYVSPADMEKMLKGGEASATGRSAQKRVSYPSTARSPRSNGTMRSLLRTPKKMSET